MALLEKTQHNDAGHFSVKYGWIGQVHLALCTLLFKLQSSIKDNDCSMAGFVRLGIQIGASFAPFIHNIV